MPRQKKLRYAIYFLFTILVYWRAAYIPIFQSIDQAAWRFGVTSIFGSRLPVSLGLGLAFPFFVCAFSFALLNTDVYRIHPLKLGLSVLAATGACSLSQYILAICQYRLWVALVDHMTASELVIVWAVHSISFAMIVGLCAVLFHALLCFSAKEPMPKAFPCKKSAMVLLLLIAASLQLLENACTPAVRPLLFGTFSNTTGFRWMRQIAFLLDSVTIAAMFMVAVFTDIRIHAPVREDGPISRQE